MSKDFENESNSNEKGIDAFRAKIKSINESTANIEALNDTEKLKIENEAMRRKADLDRAERHARGDWSSQASDNNNNNNNNNDNNTNIAASGRGNMRGMRGRGRGFRGTRIYRGAASNRGGLTHNNLKLHDQINNNQDNNNDNNTNDNNNNNDANNEQNANDNNNNDNNNANNNETDEKNNGNNENANEAAAAAANDANVKYDENGEPIEFPTIEEQKELDARSVFVKDVCLCVPNICVYVVYIHIFSFLSVLILHFFVLHRICSRVLRSVFACVFVSPPALLIILAQKGIATVLCLIIIIIVINIYI